MCVICSHAGQVGREGWALIDDAAMTVVERRHYLGGGGRVKAQGIKGKQRNDSECLGIQKVRLG